MKKVPTSDRNDPSATPVPEQGERHSGAGAQPGLRPSFDSAATMTHYRQLVECLPVALFVQSEGKFVFLNPGAVTMLGAQSETELVGRPVIDFIHPDFHEPFSECIQRLNDAGASAVRQEEDWVRVDGSVFVGEIIAVPYACEGCSGVLVSLYDVSPRKETEGQLDQFFKLSLDMLCIAGPDFHFRRVSPAFMRTLGWSADELQSRPFLDFIHPDDRVATLREVDRQLLAGESVLNFENRYRHKDGTWRILSWRSTPQEGGLMFASARDVTAQREADTKIRQLNAALERRIVERSTALAELHSKEEESRAVVDNLLDCVITIDAKGTVRAANPGMERVLGFSADEVIGRNVSMLMPEPHRSAHDGYLERYARTGEAHIIGIGREVEGRHKDGRLIPLDLAITKYAVHGEYLFIGTLRDIRERKRFIADLTQARAEAEQANRAKSAFLATMSHEIRTPMNGVVGMVDVLAQSRLSAHQADLIKTIRESAAALLAIIDDILDFSKIEAGRLDIEQVPVSVADVVEGVCSSLVATATRREVSLSLFVSPTLPERVLSDDVRLRQVLYNLVGNAIKFSSGRPKQRGHVSIRVDRVNEAPLQVTFCVSDNGIGMAEDTLRGLFTPFTQAEISTTRRFGGTGLGLAICQRLVGMLGGDITVASTVGIGSVFTVTLPFRLAEEQPHRALQDLSGLDCVVMVSPVLRTEDDIRVYLEHAGARVSIAQDAEHAAQLAGVISAPVVVIQDVGHNRYSMDALRASLAGGPDTRHLVITRGRRRRARLEAADVVMLDGDALGRQALLRAAAVAAGRASPEAFQAISGDVAQGLEVVPLSIADARAQGRLILVAEDDEINQKVILQQLRLLGFAAEVAATGTEALKLWRVGSYVLLLSDLHMPEMDGYTLAQSIRREESGLQRMPIVALTANALRGEANRALEAGMDEYLTKPVQLSRLKIALEKWVPAAADAAVPVVVPSVAPGDAVEAMPTVDFAVLQRLVGDDPATIRELLVDYLESLRRLAEALRAALATDDAAHVGAVAHKLKSSSRSVGAGRLGDICAELENMGISGNVGGIARDIAEFDAAVAAVEAEIDHALANN